VNEFDLLKDFRSGQATEPGQDRLAAAWARVHEQLGAPAISTVPARPRRRRWAVSAAVGAAAAALLLAVSITLPKGSRPAAAAVSFTNEDGYIVAIVQDPQADSEALTAAFAQHGLDITLKLLPVSPSLVGKFVEQDTNAGGSEIETLFDDQAACTAPGSASCPIGLKIPLDFQGQANLTLGRASESDELYATVNDAFAPGELLHCSGLRGMTVDQAIPVLTRLGVDVVWRSNDQTIDRVDGIDPSTISGQYVTDALPRSLGSVYVWAAPQPSPTPEPGTPLAAYYERLDRGC